MKHNIIQNKIKLHFIIYLLFNSLMNNYGQLCLLYTNRFQFEIRECIILHE